MIVELSIGGCTGAFSVNFTHLNGNSLPDVGGSLHPPRDRTVEVGRICEHPDEREPVYRKWPEELKWRPAGLRNLTLTNIVYTTLFKIDFLSFSDAIGSSGIYRKIIKTFYSQDSHQDFNKKRDIYESNNILATYNQFNIVFGFKPWIMAIPYHHRHHLQLLEEGLSNASFRLCIAQLSSISIHTFS